MVSGVHRGVTTPRECKGWVPAGGTSTRSSGEAVCAALVSRSMEGEPKA